MSLSISLSQSAEDYFREEARVAGVDVATHVASTLDRMASTMRSFQKSDPTASFVEEMTDDDLASVIDEDVHAYRAERGVGRQK